MQIPELPDDSEANVPPWFSNRDDMPPPEDADGTTLRRRIIVAAAVLVIAVLLLIPVLQAALLQDRRNNLPDEAYQRAALQFASAVFFSRSTGQAMLFAADDARADVEDVVAYYRDLPPNSPSARVQVGSTPCPRTWQDARECYTGNLFDRNGGFTPGIQIGLSDDEGEPVVIFVEIDRTVVRRPGPNRL